MSTQKRIDQYFKCTAGNKGTNYGGKLANETNRWRPSLSLGLKNRTIKDATTPVRTSSAKKRTLRCSNLGTRNESYKEIRVPNKSMQSSIAKLPVNDSSCHGKSIAHIKSSDVEIINSGEVTTLKKTIKSFVKECNSPTSNPSPGRMSLKRRKNSLPELQSPPKRKLTNDDIIPLGSQPEVIESSDEVKITFVSSGLQTGKLAISQDDSIALPRTLNNAETLDTNAGTNSSSSSTGTSSTFGCDFPDDFDPEIVELSMEINDETLGTDLSKAPIVNQTSDKLIPALSGDWQGLLNVANTQHRPQLSNDCKEKIKNGSIGSPTIESEGNDEDLAYQETRRASINLSIKSTPRRALFSPPKTAVNSSSEIKACRSGLPPTIGDKATSTPTNIDGSSNLLPETNGTSYMPKMPDGPTNSTPKKTPPSSSKRSFSPRVSNSPQKVRKERVDTYLATRAVENLNQTKQGIIPLNDFDLEAVYAKESFELQYGSLNTRAAIKYEAKDVQIPEDKHADHFFMVLVDVFSEPINCGYFNDDELDKVFSMMTLSPEAQSLLVRMLKRKRRWHRVSAIQYAEIAADLRPYFRELVQHGFLDDDFGNEEMSTLLELLQVDEIKTICQGMHINSKGVKSKLIEGLVKLSTDKHSLFPGIKTPSSALRNKVTSMLEACIRFPQTVEDLLNRIFILLIPDQDPEETMVDAFNMLMLVHIGQKIFPPTPKKRFPIFRNRSHLIRYGEARSAWNHTINAGKNKDWNKVRALGQLAYDRLQPYFASNNSMDESEMSTLPTHVKRFDPNYAWTKVLAKSVDAYKKTKEGIDTAAQFLEALISRPNRIPGNRIRWYGELALIEMHHRKDLEKSANITIEALTRNSLTEIDLAEMLERAKKILKRKQGISSRTKERLIEAVQQRQEIFIFPSEPVVNEIEARMVEGNVTGSKSMWSVKFGTDVGYMTVERVALRHYYQKGFKGGLHCEGALPVTLFATLFWSEIYEIAVPGAFVSLYQDAPLDLYSSCFFDNRRERIEGKLKMFRTLDFEYLSQLMHEDFVKYRHYQSLMHGTLFPHADDFKDLVECLGKNGVIQICERLIGNYNQWKSGFPDLVVWDSATKTCKIVEVKGPGDTLSTKQRMWIHFLESIGIPVEVCVVKSVRR